MKEHDKLPVGFPSRREVSCCLDREGSGKSAEDCCKVGLSAEEVGRYCLVLGGEVVNDVYRTSQL